MERASLGNQNADEDRVGVYRGPGVARACLGAVPDRSPQSGYGPVGRSMEQTSGSFRL